MSLEVASTWNGDAVGVDERVGLQLAVLNDALHIEVDAPFHADPAPLGAPGIWPGLWRYEVVEVFVCGGSDASWYTEIELSPHGHHLVLKLAGVRHVVAEGLPIGFEVRAMGSRWVGHARVPLAHLPATPWRVNGYAIHGVGASRRYLAHAAPGGTKPDFHRLRSFVPWAPEGDLGCLGVAP